MLQWGHVQSDVETYRAVLARDIHRVASMGPRPIGRGNLATGRSGNRKRTASMGPRPIGRGNPSTRVQ